MSGSTGKSFDISKRLVWEAYRKVRSNAGAAGVDGESVADFESDLKNNLYKIWNRMSSGTYFPPPVRAVEIPKADGGTRVLGVPTVADRIAQTVVALQLEPRTEAIFHRDSYGYRPGRSAHDALTRCRERCRKYDWVIDLDIQKFFDTVPWDLVVKAVEAHRRPVGAAVCQAVACRAAATARRDAERTGPRNSTRLRGVTGAGQPVHALRVRCVADPGPSPGGVRALRRRRRGALPQRNRGPPCAG